ncbi:MAG: dTMP kinase [Pseudomonadota bacterium]|nr:dTMP kinase [Pseudomonadota bacterium]MEC7830237.1 dTMP kinase [Pseudomonadota bacterium]MEC9382754.1 dTMP kinase [Pseudomonadota bacterium]
MDNLFITFEGGDGSGKSTQVDILYNYFINLGIDVVKTREPGGTPSAEILRDLLTKGDIKKWTPMSEALLMWASRFEHLTNFIRPALNSKKVVICDRFYDSTYAYQGVAHGLGLSNMIELKKLIIGDIEPTITFILDIDPEIGLKRTSNRGDKENRFENYDLDFHNKIRQAFLKIADSEKERCIIINAELSEKEISKIIKNRIDKIININN